VDVSPIARRIFEFIAEVVGKNTSRPDERRNDMFSKIVAEPTVAIFDQASDENIGLEKVYPHADERSISTQKPWARIQRLLLKTRNPESLVHFNNTKLRRVFYRTFDCGNSHVSVRFHVLRKNIAVVHVINVIARNDQYKLGPGRLDDRQVFEDCVRRAPVSLVGGRR
jgi:hypothetical protein